MELKAENRHIYLTKQSARSLCTKRKGTESQAVTIYQTVKSSIVIWLFNTQNTDRTNSLQMTRSGKKTEVKKKHTGLESTQ